MRINTNVIALTTNAFLSKNGKNLTNSSGKLSTGRKINNASDAPTGMAISTKMRTQIKGLSQANQNSKDALSLVQTVEGSMTEIGDMVQRMRELTVQAANSTYGLEDTKKLVIEVSALEKEITSMASRTQFNGKYLATGTYSGDGVFTTVGGVDYNREPLRFQIGNRDGETVSIAIGTITATGLGLSSIADRILKAKEAEVNKNPLHEKVASLLDTIDSALNKILMQRVNVGAFQNRVDYVASSLESSELNLTSALSRIEDTDMADEMVKYTTANVLNQYAMSMLAQANQRPNELISLLK